MDSVINQSTSTSTTIELDDSNSENRSPSSTEKNNHDFKWAALLFSKVYCLLLLRSLCFTVMECYAMYDESVSAFFSGTGGVVIVTMIWLIRFIVSGYTSLSSRFGPENPSNQRRFIALTFMECLVYSGAAANLYHIDRIHLIDILLLNGSLAAFYFGHVLFFCNPWICYHGLYGAFYGVLCFGSTLVAFNLSSSYPTSGGDPSNDDPSAAGPANWQSVELACVGLLCCFWYSLETHVVVSKRHRFRFEHHHQDCFFVILCFAYADVWNATAKCRFFVTKSSATTKMNGARATEEQA